MFRLLVLILVCSFGPVDIRAQGRAGQQKVIFWFVDLGADTHVGQEKMISMRGLLNPFYVVDFYGKKNYSNPGCRLKLSVMLYNARNTYFGIQSGITFRVRELYGSIPYNLMSVPVQLRVLRKIDGLGNNSLYMDIAGGLNIFRAATDDLLHKEETGPLFTVGILLKLKKGLTLRGGYEYQIDYVSSTFWGDPSNPIKETLVNAQRRENMYLSMGLLF